MSKIVHGASDSEELNETKTQRDISPRASPEKRGTAQKAFKKQ